MAVTMSIYTFVPDLDITINDKETFTSELQKDLEDMFSMYYMHIGVCNRFKSSTTH